MAVDKEKISGEIKEMVCEIIEIEPSELKGDAKFVDDLGVDSLMALEILAALEKKYKVKIPEEKLMELSTLDQTIALAISTLEGQTTVAAASESQAA